MTYPQGGIVTAADPFGNGPKRPYLILSNDDHPFHGQEYIATVVTTTRRPPAVDLDPSDFTRGSLPRRSYVSPWNPVTLKDHMIGKLVATVADSVVDDTVATLNTYIATP